MIVERYGLEADAIDADEGSEEARSKAAFRIAFCNLTLTRKDGRPAEVPGHPYLHVGSIGAAYSKENLESAGITHILCLSRVIKLMFPNKFEYKRVNMVDQPDFALEMSVLEECFVFIEAAKQLGGKVLVHCMQGKSRAVSITVAYLICRCNTTFDEALSAIRQVRPIACPNTGFSLALRAIEREQTEQTEQTEQRGQTEQIEQRGQTEQTEQTEQRGQTEQTEQRGQTEKND
jgi:protein-tyrosine phosphatase